MSTPVAPSLVQTDDRKIQGKAWIGVAVTLFKLRVVALLLLAAFAGMILASGGVPGFWEALLLLVTGGMSAGGASAINQYLERERDSLMKRTRRRPLPLGQLAEPRWALAAGLALVALSTLIALPFNPMLALFLA
jgi:protoheme IX farnesyltransferase